LEYGIAGWVYVLTAPAVMVVERTRRRQWNQREARARAAPAAQPIAPA
jgi:hypothetical protein